MRFLMAGFIASAHLVGPFASMALAAPGTSAPKLEPLLCSEVINAFLMREYGAKDENSLPDSVTKTKYDAKGLKESFEKAEQHLDAEVKKGRPEDPSAKQKYILVLQDLSILRAKYYNSHHREYDLKKRLEDTQTIKGGPGLAELKASLKSELDKAKNETEIAQKKFYDRMFSLESKLGQEGLEVELKSGANFTVVKSNNAKQTRYVLDSKIKNPAKSALNEINELVRFSHKSVGSEKPVLGESLPQDTEFIQIKSKVPEELDHKISKEMERGYSKLELAYTLRILEVEAKKNPELKSLQAEYEAKKKQLESMEPSQLNAIQVAYKKMRHPGGLQILRKNGVIVAAAFSDFGISCDEKGKVKATSDDYKFAHALSKPSSLKQSCEKTWDEQSECQILFKDLNAKQADTSVKPGETSKKPTETIQ